MNKNLTNFLTYNQPKTLNQELKVIKNQVNSEIISVTSSTVIVLFSFDDNCNIPTHSTKGEALIQCIDGIGQVTIDDKDYQIKKGEYILIPVKAPHSVKGIKDFKMLLTIIKE